MTPRQGQLIMIAGRSGAQKSGFALYWLQQMGLPTLYFSGDMTPFEATSRLACMELGWETEDVERWWTDPIEGPKVHEALTKSPIKFSFGNPITFDNIWAEIQAWVEIYNEYPPIIAIDNLMDVEGCADEDNAAQRQAMSYFYQLLMNTGSTIVVIHHATDKSERGDQLPGLPPSKREVKNGVGEKPQFMWTVALDPESLEFRVACVKQRMGKSDPSAKNFVRLQADPKSTRFGPLNKLTPHWGKDAM